MRYAAAFALATLAGGASPDVSTISKILGSVGIECDQAKAQQVVDACKGKNLDQVIEEGMKKLSAMPAAGPAAAAPAAGGAAQAATTDAKKGAAKEEPKKEEKKKESDDEGDDMVKKTSIPIFLHRIIHCLLFFRVLVYSIKSLLPLPFLFPETKRTSDYHWHLQPLFFVHLCSR